MDPFLEAGPSLNNNEDVAVSPDENVECEPCDQGGDSGEATPSIGFKQPTLPSPQEVRDHERIHMPFRDWCKHCVLSRARNELHKAGIRISVDQDGVPKISWDYMHMHEEGADKRRPEIVTGEGLPIIVFKDSITKAIIARVLPENVMIT